MRNGVIKQIESLGTMLRLWIRDSETGEIRPYAGDARPTAQALENLFGMNDPVGQEISYSVSSWGGLESIGEPQ